tara:strand:+ start:180 stop:392 length:213 start_codon:yes stop_codon:yes gene_type:complete
MIFNFDTKQYDSEKLSDSGKMHLQKLQNIIVKKNQLSIEFTDLEVLQKHYSDLLKPELPKEEKEEQKTGA